MDLQRTDATDANGTPIWQIILQNVKASDILDFYTKIQNNLTQLQADAGITPTTTPPPVTTPPVTVPPTTPASSGFRGIFAFNNMSNTALFSDHPNVAGTVLTRYWAELEPQAGQYNWALIDNDMKPWVTAGKSVIIRVSTAGWKSWQPTQNSVQGTPQWVFNQGVKQVKDDDGSIKPQYWHPAFLSNLADFIHALAAKYDGNPHVTAIEMGIGDGGETKVDTSKGSDVLKLWQAVGYSDAVWFGTLTSLINMYAQNFKQTPLVLMPDATFIGGTPGYNEQKVIDYVVKLNNKNIWLQDNGLIGGKSLASSLASLPHGWPLLSEQRNPTSTSGTTLESDLSTALAQGAVAILVFTSDLQNTSNQTTLQKYAAMVKK